MKLAIFLIIAMVFPLEAAQSAKLASEPNHQPSCSHSFLPSDAPSDMPSDAPSMAFGVPQKIMRGSKKSAAVVNAPRRCARAPSNAHSDVPSDSPSETPSNAPSIVVAIRLQVIKGTMFHYASPSAGPTVVRSPSNVYSDFSIKSPSDIMPHHVPSVDPIFRKDVGEKSNKSNKGVESIKGRQPLKGEKSVKGKKSVKGEKSGEGETPMRKGKINEQHGQGSINADLNDSGSVENFDAISSGGHALGTWIIAAGALLTLCLM